MEIERAQDSISSSRKDQMASGDRSDKIRTYNFPQSRITDHRTNFTKYGIERMLNGDFLDEFIEEYQKKAFKIKLDSLLEELNLKNSPK
jgi:peptide chain release factor 1